MQEAELPCVFRKKYFGSCWECTSMVLFLTGHILDFNILEYVGL